MLLEKVFYVVKIAFILLVVSTEGGRRKKNRKKAQQEQADEPPPTEEVEATPSLNICDIQSPSIIYCYCNNIEYNKADEGNCWIFNDTSNEEYSDMWEWFATQTRINHLTLHLRPDGTLKEIPTVAILHLPELAKFEVQYATIHTIHPFAFGNSTTLEIVSLTRNSIAVLERNAFANLPSLTSISLGENQITELNRTVFTNLPKLTSLYIDRNNISSIEDYAFHELSSLKELELFSNQIQVIVPETFKGLESLNRLDLHKNWIEVLGDMTFQDLKSLQSLDLMGNSIKYIAPNSFYGLKKLRTINLQDNKLLSLGTEVFEPTTNLLHLDLRKNVLETLLEDTVRPILKRMEHPEMNVFLKGNNFRCDTRLRWMFTLYNKTKSSNVKSALNEVVCYLEMGTLPPRLDMEPRVTPIYEVTTLGIGPQIELLKLLPNELPDPLVRTPATFTHDEDCDCDDEDQNKQKKKKKKKKK